MMYSYLFGPVPSRRLGMSLGVDLVPHKVCSLNCVYCECGRTTNLTLERKEYVPCREVTSELADFMKNNPAPDYITFSGSGEPALNSRIGEVLRFIKSSWPKLPVAVLTNGTLFFMKEVREELLPADLVLPSLDAASDKAFRRINRPFKSLNIEQYIEGLISFRKEYGGRIWLEVLIIPGYNDSRSELELLHEAIRKISPDLVQLNTLDRPGAVEGLKPASREMLEDIVRFWEMDNVEIIAAPASRREKKSYRPDTESAILETVSRRPCTLEDLSEILGLHINEVNKYLDVLEEEGKIEPVREQRGLFYKLKK
ncbi:MAG: radical SAM protein [Candidatus Latescibacteria bacterium]|nr:radical SAM protein [bacterium]MBD3422891.1 radical SAM protein [Candidatus Latescibacterota bacterium]